MSRRINKIKSKKRKLKTTTRNNLNQLPVTCSQDSSPTTPLLCQLMVVDCSPTPLEVSSQTLGRVCSLTTSQRQACSAHQDQHQPNQKLAVFSAAVAPQAAFSTSNPVAYPQSRTPAHHYSAPQPKVATTRTILGTAPNLKPPRTFKQTHQRAHIATNTSRHAN